MTKCPNCNATLKPNANFCTQCGYQIIVQDKKVQTVTNADALAQVAKDTINEINQKIELENNHTPISRKFWFAAGAFLLIILIAYWELIEVHPAIVFLSFFFGVCCVVIALMFRSRSKKLQSLISGDSLIASWVLNSTQKEMYVNYLFQKEKQRNKIILFTITVISIVIFGIFILVIDEGKIAMLGVMVGLIILMAIFAYGMPYYYKKSNKKGDGKILIGAKYAYINGYFHNWDFPLSGLSKIKEIHNPFYGLHINYYYTDRTLKNNEEIYIPANLDVDLGHIINALEVQNS